MLPLLALLLAHGGHESKPGKPDPKPPVEETATAADIWKARCKGCHKEDGRGNAEKKVPDLTGAKWQSKHSDDDVRAAIEDGFADTKMNAFKGKMTAAQLDALIAFIRELKK
jgi:mono/diheme cytochrome c family protein